MLTLVHDDCKRVCRCVCKIGWLLQHGLRKRSRRFSAASQFSFRQNLPPYAAALLGMTRLALNSYRPQGRQLKLAAITKPMLTEQSIASALHQAEQGKRWLPIIGPHDGMYVKVPFVKGFVFLTTEWFTRLMADSFFRIAGVGHREVGQRRRQRNAPQRAAAVAQPDHQNAESASPNQERVEACVSMRFDSVVAMAGLRGELGKIIRLTRRLSRT